MITAKISLHSTQVFMLFITLLSVGCASLQNLNEESMMVEQLDKRDFTALNGIYCDIQDTVFGEASQYPKPARNPNEISLASRLFMNSKDWHDHSEKTVEINFTTHKKATVNLYQNDSLIFTKYMRGNFRNGYFYLRPKALIIPFFPVFYVHRFQSARIGKMGNKLIVDHSWAASGFALLGGGMSKGNNTAIYEKLP